MTSRYESSEATLTPEAFNDGPLLAELLRVYNIKRAFCGQSRLDYGTPTTDVFKNATNYENGPVDADINTDAGARDASATHLMLFGLSFAIPQTFAAQYTSGADKYIWVNPGTDDPLEFPETWAGTLSATLLRDVTTWHSAITGMIDAVNAMQEMRLLTKPTSYLGASTFRGYYITYDMESVPRNFEVSDSGEYLSESTVLRPKFSSFVLEEGEVFLLDPTSYPPPQEDAKLTRWAMSAAGFSGEWAHAGVPNRIGISGGTGRDYLSVYKRIVPVTFNVPATGPYTVTVSGFIPALSAPVSTQYFPFNLAKMSSETFTLTMDGESDSWTIQELWEKFLAQQSFSFSFTRTLTAPSTTLTLTSEVSGLDSLAKYWDGATYADVTEVAKIGIKIGDFGYHYTNGNNTMDAVAVEDGTTSDSSHIVGMELRPYGANERPTFAPTDASYGDPPREWDGTVDDFGRRYTMAPSSFALSGRIRVYTHPLWSPYARIQIGAGAV